MEQIRAERTLKQKKQSIVQPETLTPKRRVAAVTVNKNVDGATDFQTVTI